MTVSRPIIWQVLEDMPLGIVVLDREGRVVLYNRYEEQLARRQRQNVIGHRFFEEVAPCMDVKELGGAFRSGIDGEPLQLATEFAFNFPFMDGPRDVVVRLNTIYVEERPYGCLLIEDVSAQRAVERMKETLSSLLVHDLKNPLSVVLGNLGLVQESLARVGDPALVAEIERAVGDGGNAARRLEKMILDLLDITRLETGALPLHRSDVDAGRLVTELVADAQSLGRHRRVTVVAEVPATTVRATVDVELLRRALDNLVENGVRHAAIGGRVVVRVATTPTGALFEVEDDGEGIATEERGRIFEKYQRVSDGRARRNRGLGLTFVKLAARAHGGDAEVVDGSSVGAVFRLTTG